MSLRDRILSDLKDAMRAKDDVKVSTLRLIQAAIKDRDIAARAETGVRAVICLKFNRFCKSW